MEIIPFFSFKGGVGRTQAMLNVGAEIARRGRNVVLMDFDVHAPGLSLMRCMLPISAEQQEATRPGILDFFEWLIQTAEAVKQATPPPQPIFLPACAYQPQMVERLPEGAGKLTFVPCADFSKFPALAQDGQPMEPNEDYSQRLLKMESSLESVFAAIRQHPSGDQRNPVIEQIRDQFWTLPEKERPDYILIDSRTGITSIREMVFSLSMDRIVLISGLNDQNLWGLRSTLNALQLVMAHIPNWLRRIVFIASPIPEGEAALKEGALAQYAAVLDDYIDPEEAEMFGREGLLPDPIGIPYNPQLALLEDPILLRHPKEKISHVYESVADRLGAKAHDPLQRLREPEAQRQQAAAPWLPHVHPFAKVPWWDAGLTAEHRERFLASLNMTEKPPWLHHILNYISNPISLREDKAATKVLAALPNLSSNQVQGLLETLRAERATFFGLPYAEWGELSQQLASTRVHWHQQTASRLGAPLAFPEAHLADSISAASWGRYWTGLAAAFREQGNRELSLHLLESGFTRFQGRPDFAAPASHALLMLDRFDLALTVAQQWERECPPDSDELGWALCRQAEIHQILGKLAKVEPVLILAQEAFRKSANVRGLAKTLLSLGDLALRRSQLDLAAENQEAARLKYTEVGDNLGLANTLKSLGDLALRRGELDLAAEHLEAARLKCTEAGDNLGLANSLLSLGNLALRRGQLDLAAEHLDAARLKYTEIGENQGLATTLQRTGDLALRRGQLDLAAEHLEAARLKYTEVGSNLGLANVKKSHAEMAFRAGDTAKALSLVTEVKSEYQQLQDLEGLWEAQLLEVDILTAEGKAAEASSLATQIAAESRGQGYLLICREAEEKLAQIQLAAD